MEEKKVVDPNPARTASDSAASVAKAAKQQAAVNNKAANGKAYRDRKKAVNNAAILADQVKQGAADEAALTHVSDVELINTIMVDLGVTVLHENSSQEYFTNLNLAINSEGGKASRIRTHTLEA